MTKTIETVYEYKIIQTEKDYIVINTLGEYENHSHYKKLSTCYLVIDLMHNKVIPYSPYILESVRRLTIDRNYYETIIKKQESLKQRRKKPYYINVNKGGRK